MANCNFTESNPTWLNYNLFAYYYEEIIDSYHKICEAFDHIRFITGIDDCADWADWNYKPFLPQTKKLEKVFRHTKYHDIQMLHCNLQFDLALSELQQCIDDMSKYSPKLSLRKAIFIDTICMKMSHLQQLVKSLKSDAGISVDGTNPFDVLPDIVMINIFNNLSIKGRQAIEFVNKRWCQLSRNSWGFLTSLSESDYCAISESIFPVPSEEEEFAHLKRLELKEKTEAEMEKRLLLFIERMCDWKTGKVCINLDLNKLTQNNVISGNNLKRIRKMCPYIKSIFLKESDSDVLMEPFLHLNELFIKTLNDSESSQNISLYHFGKDLFPKLEVLVLGFGCRNRTFSFKSNPSLFGHLVTLVLFGVIILDDDCNKLLANCPALQNLDLSNTRVTAYFVYSWFHSDKPREGYRKVNASLNLLTERLVWQEIKEVGKCLKYHTRCWCCCEDVGTGYAIRYKSWTFAVDEEYWNCFYDEMKNEPCMDVMNVLNALCWRDWFPRS